MLVSKSGCAAFAVAQRKSDGVHIITTETVSWDVNGGAIARNLP